MSKEKEFPTRARFWAHLILGGGATVTLCMFFYSLYRYTTGEMQFATSMGAVVYWVLPVILSGLLFTCLRLRPAFKISLAIVSLSLSVLAYGAELCLAWSNSGLAAANKPLWGIYRAPQEEKILVAKLAEQTGVKIDTRDRVEVLADLRKRNIDAVPPVMLGGILSDGAVKFKHAINGRELIPIGGISNKATVLCSEFSPYITYRSDEHGFRNPPGIWKSDRLDMAVLGESFVAGYCVPDGKTFVDLFREHYPNVLNLGMSGESSLFQLAAIKEYLPPYAPKIVIWVFCEGIDLYDLRDEATSPLLMRYLESDFSQHLLDRQDEIDHVLGRFVGDTSVPAGEAISNRGSKTVDEWLQIFKLSSLRSKLGLIYGISSDEAEALSVPEEANHNLFRDTLVQAKALTSGWGGALYFVYLPSWRRYGGDPTLADIEHTRVLKIVNSLGIPIIDVQPAFQAQNDPLALFPGRRFGHYDETGNQIVAETVMKFLAAPTPGPTLAGFPKTDSGQAQ